MNLLSKINQNLLEDINLSFQAIYFQMFFIQLRDLCKSYGPVMALNGLNLKVPKGSLYGLLGPNGAGKSTALRIICTLLSPDSGHVEVGGHNVLLEEKETRRRLGYVAQDVAIDKILTQMYGYIEDEKAGKKISSSNKPKMYLRMARLLAGTDDSVFIDTVDNLLSKNATGDEIKNALRGISERVIPKARKRVFSDRLHHGIPLELMDVLMKQEPEVMLDFLQAAEDDGRFFGDSKSNIDNSLQEQSHTAAKDKATSKFKNHPYELGIRGMKEFSAHNEGTNKGYDKSLDKIYAKGAEMYEAFKPAIAEAEYLSLIHI